METHGHTTSETSSRRLTDEQVEALAQQHGVTVEQIRLAEQIADVVKAPTTAPSTTGCRALDDLLDKQDADGLAAALVCQRLAFLNNSLGDACRKSLESRLQAYLDGSAFTYTEDIERAKLWLTLLDGLVAADLD